ncbi:hypothetical protein AVU32_gp042 [Vibrio phage ValKK3]|uniref:Uncharacterized protein n=2 Tax=Schizotequatrovirus valkk3 TaxID=1914021 RepID=A0A126HH72_9CAUD|nr:hypothetical protein AVU32_gp042 [Vibrio phage ValKK3]AJT60883.1 hypothetical protein [Vibrio phage ValKK3]ALP47225.1 hypothetical protein phiGrn1_0327 [Vibrio phage phi-Grn1]URQ03418.1 hypothetical protein PVA23_41 [Vibrio phage PVA23]
MVSLLKAVNSEFTSYTDRVLPSEIAEKVARACEQEYWATFYTHGCTSLDTADRDQVFDMIASELGLENGWPMYGSSDEYKQHFKQELEKLELA